MRERPSLDLRAVDRDTDEPLRGSECKREPREDENPDDSDHVALTSELALVYSVVIVRSASHNRHTATATDRSHRGIQTEGHCPELPW